MAIDEGGEAPMQHSVTMEGDICRWTLVGDVSAEQILRLIDARERLGKDFEAVLILVDVRRVGDVSPEARRLSATPSKLNIIATAIFGASFHVRVLAKLITKAAAVLRRVKETDSPTQFFETEAESLAWLDERRAEYRSRRG